MLLDYLHETMSSGGWVIFPIWLAGALGFFLGITTYIDMRRDIYKTDYAGFFDRFFGLLHKDDISAARQLLKDNSDSVTMSLALALDYRHLKEGAFRNVITEKLSLNVYRMDRHLPLMTVLAAVAPLLGLLGTVTGMVHTFQIITEYGNSNPILMAGGISEALITTQSGLIIAFPLVIMKHRLQDKIIFIKKQVELGLTRFINNHYAS